MTADAGSDHGGGAPDPAPDWLTRLAKTAAQMPVPHALRPPASGGRPAAVLILFGTGPSGPDVLLIERAADLRKHAGQPAFPGGAIDAADGGPVPAALREAAEETGVDPDGVLIVGVMPELYIPRSDFRVTPVLGWWHTPVAVSPGEIAAVLRVPVTELASPATRMMIRYPAGLPGPAFRARGLIIWGFTALLLDRLLALGGWQEPWDSGRITALGDGELPAGWPAGPS